jgi:hypothetical protein
MSSKLVDDVTETVRFIQEEAKEHRRQIESFERFFDLLTRLVDKHANEFVPTMQKLGRHFSAGLAHERTLVDAEERLATTSTTLQRATKFFAASQMSQLRHAKR